jgi:iron uptake system component EfeO
MLAFMRSPRPVMAAASAVATLALAAALAACGGTPQPDVMTMTTTGCGGTWHVNGPGWHTFQLRNGDTVGGEVDLVDPATGGIYDEIVGFGPQTTTPMALNVGSGKYAFSCRFQTNPETILDGPTITVAGHVAGTPAQLPVPYNDLVRPAKAYEDYVAAGLRTLLGQVTTLNGDVARGDLAAARRDWLPAHLQYQRLGAAYGAFGDFDGEIDGRADAVGVTSSKWTGFYRLEDGLWHGQPASELKPVAAKLTSDVKGLRATWPQQQVQILDLGLRTHEILENALQFQLSGHDDYGSGTTLATALANVDGTRELLSLLRPALAPRYAGLPAVYTWLDRLQALLLAEHLPNGRWVPVSQLPSAARQAIDAACDQALTELAPIPTITEPRNT